MKSSKLSSSYIDKQIAKIDAMREELLRDFPSLDIPNDDWMDKRRYANARKVANHRSKLGYVDGFWAGWTLAKGDTVIRDITTLTQSDYTTLLKTGLLFEVFPEATGDWAKDTDQAIPPEDNTKFVDVLNVETKRVEWSDEHPLNREGTKEAVIKELFP